MRSGGEEVSHAQDVGIACGGSMSALLMLAVPVSAAQRAALVIGNAAYAHAPRLANPLNDAHDIADALERLGFAVTRIDNADQTRMRRALQDFSRAASASEAALVFYAGHGIEVDSRNFLVPVDARLLSDADVEFEAVPLELVSRAVERARGLALVILDACRENPFAASMQRAGATRSIGRGLARIEPTGETLVAYAAKEGTVAADGRGRNSPYSAALLAHIEEPGLEVGLMFRKVRDAVLAATGGAQEPFVYGSLSSNGAWLAAAPEPAPVAASPAAQAPATPTAVPSRADADLERLFWDSVKDSDDPADLQAYLERYPNGVYVTLAENRLKRFGGVAPQPAMPASADATGAAPDDEALAARLEAERLAAEREFWISVKDSGSAAELRAYIDRYPDGTYALLARSRLKQLEEAAEPPSGSGADAPAATEEPEVHAAQAALETAQSVSALRPSPEDKETALGLTRAERRSIQMGLASLGFDPGPADGLFGRGTRAALSAWQSAKGETATGWLTESEARALKAAGEQAEAEAEGLAVEREFWASVRDSEVPAQLEAYLEAYPNGLYANLARQRRDALLVQADDAAFARADSSGTVESYAQYLSAYPSGRHADDARKRQSALQVETQLAESEGATGGEQSEAGSEWEPGMVFQDCPECPEMVVLPPSTSGLIAVGRYEVTFSEWDACWHGGGCDAPGQSSWVARHDNYPVTMVTWNDARQYVLWLSSKAGKSYRLLREAEWRSVSAGARAKHRRPIKKVGSDVPNLHGLHDVEGNVWEWIEDCWRDNGGEVKSGNRLSNRCWRLQIPCG